MKKHTKGPWEARVLSNKAVVMTNHHNGNTEKETFICSDLEDYENERDIEEIDANTKLIAAAPILLEIIRTMAKCCEEALNDDWDRSDDGFEAMLQQCQGAIAAATD